MDRGINRNGGLTLVPMEGFEPMAISVKKIIDQMGNKMTIPDIVYPKFGLRAQGEPYLRLDKKHIGGHDCVILTSGPGTESLLIRLQFLLAYLVARRASRIAIVSGYMPLCRSDKDEGTLELALFPLVVQMLYNASSKKLDRIIAVDLHSPQDVMAAPVMGLITEVSMARRLLNFVLEEARKRFKKIVCMFPDDGALERFGSINTDLPKVNAHKKRKDSETIEILKLDGDVDQLTDSEEDILGILIDDEFATAGTMNTLAGRVMKDYNVKEIWGMAPHGIICGQAPKILSDPNRKIRRFFVTNTMPFDTNTIPFPNRLDLQPLIENGTITVYDWDKELAQIVYYHHWDESIREMR